MAPVISYRQAPVDPRRRDAELLAAAYRQLALPLARSVDELNLALKESRRAFDWLKAAAPDLWEACRARTVQRRAELGVAA